jgi:hypothetical protein
VHYICTIFTLLCALPTFLPHWSKLPRQNLLCPPVHWFCKRKEWNFCLFKIVI